MPKYTLLLKEKAPHLVSEWHNKNCISFNEAHAYSCKKVWWAGKCGHEWSATIGSRAQGAGCPYCRGLLPTDNNRLSILHPELANEWDYTKNKMTPVDVTEFSSKKVWWIGLCGHSWIARISDRTTHRTKCPYCSRRRVCATNCLAAFSPTLTKEWHPIKNKPVTPYDVMPTSHKIIWWICSQCDNEWAASVNNRNKRKGRTGCPQCAGMYFKKQKLLFDQIKIILPKVKIKYNYKHPDLRFKDTNAKMELDIYIPKLNLAVEYQGEHHFLPIVGEEKLAQSKDRDQQKRVACALYNIKLLEIDYNWDGDYRTVLDLLKDYRG